MNPIASGAMLMTTLTVQINDRTAQTARQVALQRQTTVDAIVQELLDRLSCEVSANRQKAVESLEQSFQQVSRPLGGKQWTQRDELYER